VKFKYLATICSTTIGVEECFLGKRMSTITNNRSRQTLKYLIDNRRKNLLRIVVNISIGSLAVYERSMDFPYSPRDELGFFNTV